jgi:Sulfotransferase family
MIILIDGEGASGKTVLRSLFDGHPQLSVLPTHDMIVDTLVSYPPDVRWLAYRDIPYLRRLLSMSSYYQLEQLAVTGSIEIDISVRDRITMPFDFDFWRFEADWVGQIARKPDWTVSAIIEAIHRSYVTVTEGRKREIRGHVGVGFDDPATPARLFEHIPDARLLYLHRSAEGILAARARRRSSERDMFSKVNDELTVEELLRRDKVRKIRNRLDAVRRLAGERPDQVRIIEFEELVLDTAGTMRQVADFLGIDFTPGLETSTLVGHLLRSQTGDTYVGRVLDRPEDLLSARERALIAMDADWRLVFDPRWLRDPRLLGRAAELRASRRYRATRTALRSWL